MIDVHFNAASVGELHLEMHALLIGHASRIAGTTTSYVAGTVATDEPKMTAAQKKAAEKAAKDAAEAAAKAAQQAISTGEEHVDPEADKQDAADEAADTKAAAPEPAKLTHNDVKTMLGEYVRLYGMDAAQADGAAFIGAPVLSKIPDTQADIAKAIIGIATGIEKNPNKRDMVGDIDPEKLAVLKPLVAAARAVK